MDLHKYHEHGRIICIDLKIVSFLLGQRKDYAKSPCFLSMWDSRDRENHWARKKWPERDTLKAGMPNVIYNPIVSTDKIIFPPLRIKLGFMKQFVNALRLDGKCFQHLLHTFLGLSYEKFRAGVFDGPQICTLVPDQAFVQAINDKEKATWLSFGGCDGEFLGNKKVGNYEDLASNMLSTFHNLGCKMSIKVCFLFSYLDKFPDNLGGVSDEQGERFHQDLMAVEERYLGRWDCYMLADYCWSIKRDCPAILYKRNSYKQQFFL